jgi:hypothetical protein
VLKKKKLERLDMPLAIVHRARSGRRELVVVTPATDGSPGAPRLE